MHRAPTAVLAAALLLAACGGDAPDDGANLDILEPGVEVADLVDGTVAEVFRPGQDDEPLLIGEKVRTEPAGFARILWAAGARTYVDGDTTYELVSLDETPEGIDITTRIDVGRTLHRVSDSAVDSFVVETAVGTAAVRGTVFAVDCLDACTFAVVEGLVDVTTSAGIELELVAGEQVDVAPDGVPSDVEPLEPIPGRIGLALQTEVDEGWDPDGVTLTFVGEEGDRGSTATVARGADGGDDPGDGRPDTERGRLDGVYDLVIEVTESTVPEQIGGTQTRVYTFTPSCDDGPCGGDWDPGDGRPVPFTWTGHGYAAAFVGREAFTQAACNDAGVPSFIEDFVFVVTPTEVEQIDGQLVVTAFTHEWDTDLERPPGVDETGCHPFPTQSAHVVGTGTLRR